MPQIYNEEFPTEPIQALPVAASVLNSPKPRSTNTAIEALSMPQSKIESLCRKSNPPAVSLYASTLSHPSSRPVSPAGRMSSSTMVSEISLDAGVNLESPVETGESTGAPLRLISKAFVPHISVYTSQDTEALVREKGFEYGLWEILRPFGEKIQGKVSVRDSNGMSKVVDDFSVRFTRFGEDVEHPGHENSDLKQTHVLQSSVAAHKTASRDQATLADVEAVVERHLSFAEKALPGLPFVGVSMEPDADTDDASRYYALYLRRLLSGLRISPHETFAHPVACIIAISSRNQTPIEELRRLYSDTSQGDHKLPVWVDGDFLRYYVLVHDEENDDITRSMGLFEQMKRHFGLHCHLLRLRCSHCVETDDDSTPLPRSSWMSASEEWADLRRSEDEGFEDPQKCIFESDATAICSFVREMVTQSVIPTMERHTILWNDQVASRRRGLTGRFMNLSRKWTGFGSSSRSLSIGSTNGKESYDTLGFYRADAPEAIMRKLADFAFMLRDWKLAQSTYDLLRTDFSESKAWKHHAAANEMSAISHLLIPQQLTSKSRADSIDQMLESSFYSYNTRCNSPYGALRCLILAQELLRVKGGSSIDDAARWCLRLLESNILGQVGNALVKERLAICYASKPGVGQWKWGSRRRKSAAWNILAAEAWVLQLKHIPARRCLNNAEQTFEVGSHSIGISNFTIANTFKVSLCRELSHRLDSSSSNHGNKGDVEAENLIDEESEALTDMRARRSNGVLETAPLQVEDIQEIINKGLI